MNVIGQKVLSVFKEKFSSVPTMYFSPGRINLIGEHIDYNGGFVMPAAIDKGIYYAIASNSSESIHIYSIDFNEQLFVDIRDIKKLTGWKNYVLSVVNELLLSGKAIKGFDCVFGGDIPAGAGMSSSAAVEGGLAFALNEIFNTGMSRTDLALLCQRAEHGFPGVNCGIMDQFANMMGKRDQVILLDCRNLVYEYLPMKMPGHQIVLINTKVHHTLASGEYNKRRNQCEEGMMKLKAKMNINSFRDIRKPEDLDAYRSILGDEVYYRCLYVVGEIHRTIQAAEYLKHQNLNDLGRLMYETQEGLSKLYNVSCAELDFLVQQARLNPAVIGSRLMGGGFGGCTINIVKETAMKDFIAMSSLAYEKEFGIVPEAYIVEISEGTGIINC